MENVKLPTGKSPRKKVLKRRIVSLTELAEWQGRPRQWVARKGIEYELYGNQLNLRSLFNVLDFAVFLERENNTKIKI